MRMVVKKSGISASVRIPAAVMEAARLHLDQPVEVREEAGHRPAVVLSPASYNGRTGMMVCCPTSTRIKGYPFEVAIAGRTPRVALANQVKSQDWEARRAMRKGRVSAGELFEGRAKLKALIG